MGDDGNAAGHGFEEADTEHFLGSGVNVEIHALVDGGHGGEGLVFEDGDVGAELVVGVAFDGGGVVGGCPGQQQIRRGGLACKSTCTSTGSSLRAGCLGKGFHLIDEGVEAFVVALEGGDAADYKGGFGDAVFVAVLGFLSRGCGGEVGGVDETGDEEMARFGEGGFRDGCIVVGLGGVLEVGETGESVRGFVGYVAEDDCGGMERGDIRAETKPSRKAGSRR